MPSTTIIESLYAFSDWANRKLFQHCASLTDQQLDEPREIGFGSLRNTLFHNLAAEEVWLERWTNVPWRPFPMAADGLSLPDMMVRFEQVDQQRQQLIDLGRSNDWQSDHTYKDAKGNPYTNRLKDLLLHVANHSIHHRAQALQYLKQFGIQIPGGLDYLFYKLAYPSGKQEPATVAALRSHGLDVELGSSPAVDWDRQLVVDYFAYGDWAVDKLFPLVHLLEADQLDRDFRMGMGTIRKTWLHLFDAEAWWWNNWTIGPSPFHKLPNTTSLHEVQQKWHGLRKQRNEWIDSLDATSAQRVVVGKFGESMLHFPIIESMLQLCGHGTHHRAQLVNMLRHSELKPPAIDFVVKLRESI
jgi:uncharacterized damage-inducible protein DinB